MNAKWTWIFGIATAAGLALSAVFFLATQEATGRDLIVLAMGIIVGGMIAAFIATFIFHGQVRQTNRDGGKLIAEKWAELVRELPIRTEKLAQVKEAIAENRIESVAAAGNGEVQMLEMRRAYASGYPEFAAENKANAETWRIKRAHLDEKVTDLIEIQRALEAQTDDEYLAEQKRLRGLD